MRGLTLCSYALTLLLLGQATAFAHPGPLDACGGHTTTERVEYGVQADGTRVVPSESGEYHFHLSPVEIGEAQRSLRAYHRAQRQAGQARIDDHGTFTVGVRTYDILEYTRQGEAIVHCQGDDTVSHAGIIRVRLP